MICSPLPPPPHTHTHNNNKRMALALAPASQLGTWTLCKFCFGLGRFEPLPCSPHGSSLAWRVRHAACALMLVVWRRAPDSSFSRFLVRVVLHLSRSWRTPCALHCSFWACVVLALPHSPPPPPSLLMYSYAAVFPPTAGRNASAPRNDAPNRLRRCCLSQSGPLFLKGHLTPPRC